jgi:hypothetical protein
VATSESRQPWLFSREMSDMVLGDSVYFQTDSPLTWQEGGGPSPLPFPAKEVWCALLKKTNTSGKARYRILFVALHMDMYSGDWLVHLGPESDSFSKATEPAATIGCALAE